MINTIAKFIKKEGKNSMFHYLLLMTLAIFFLTLLVVFKGNRSAEFIIFSIFTIVYVGWGIFHHSMEKTLSLKIVIEYILFGAFALLLVGSLIIN
jgi:tryptophan-rich sensory protein